jgi:hypothetical protein
VFLGELEPFGREPPEAVSRACREPGALQAVVRPSVSVLVDKLHSARNVLGAVFVCQSELRGDCLVGVSRGRSGSMRPEEAEERFDELVVSRDGHDLSARGYGSKVDTVGVAKRRFDQGRCRLVQRSGKDAEQELGAGRSQPGHLRHRRNAEAVVLLVERADVLCDALKQAPPPLLLPVIVGTLAQPLGGKPR